MDFKDCIKFANETPVCYLATVDGDQPRVRALGLWFADETGFYFIIGSIRDMYGQLQSNGKVEVCFFNPGQGTGTMMRVAGEVEFLNDLNLKKKAMEERPILKKSGLTFDNPTLIIFRVANGEAYFWTRETNFEPKKFINFGE